LSRSHNQQKRESNQKKSRNQLREEEKKAQEMMMAWKRDNGICNLGSSSKECGMRDGSGDLSGGTKAVWTGHSTAASRAQGCTGTLRDAAWDTRCHSP